jgi:hypothetical protein
MLGVDIVVVEEFTGHSCFNEDFLVILDEVGVESLGGLVVCGSQRL